MGKDLLAREQPCKGLEVGNREEARVTEQSGQGRQEKCEASEAATGRPVLEPGARRGDVAQGRSHGDGPEGQATDGLRSESQ